MYGHIFIGVIMAGFVAACLGYGSLAYLNYRNEQQEEKTRNAIITIENRRLAIIENNQKNKIAQKWVAISSKDKECRINTLTQEKICREK